METLTLEQPRALVELELTPSPLCDRADHRIVVGSKEYSGAGSFTVMCEGCTKNTNTNPMNRVNLMISRAENAAPIYVVWDE